ncbi:MAG: alpha/beta hydrolase family protein, partial [Gemmatimonadaceae bacterium]
MRFSPRAARASLMAGLLITASCATFTRSKPRAAPTGPAGAAPAGAHAGAPTAGRPPGAPRPVGGFERGFTGVMDSARARQLYVSNDPKDLPRANYERDIQAKHRTDSIYAARFAGIAEFRKVSYKSTADGMEIPAYLFAPLNKRGAKGHAAMIWVHGGVHGDWGPTMFPFVKEAVERGYVVITPEYRGSTGYGEAHHQAIDYGGMEVDDVMSATEFLKTLPYVDMDRLGMMGWSHGGFITILNATKPGTPLKAAAGIVPVTNLLFRLSLKGPGYQRSYAAEPTIRGLPFEKPDEYIKRSPLYHVENLNIPLLVHVSTNDLDVNYVEDQ